MKLEQEAEHLLKRFHSPAYKAKDYFSFTPAYRKKILEDFRILVSFLNRCRDAEAKAGDWQKKQFMEGFTPYWLLLRVGESFVETLGVNRVTDTFLNDPHQGHKGLLDKIRARIFFARKNNHLLIIARAKNIPEAAALMKKFPVSLIIPVVNVRKLLKYRFLKLWLPIQFWGAKLLVHRRWWWKKGTVITQQHLADLEPHLKKGDILLHRTQFMLHNASMPGFWNHAMLYDGKGHIIESTPPRVRRIPWKKAAIADYICVLRPRCSEKEKDQAVAFARKRISTPYDFNFDFLSDSNIVCTELILKAYPFLKPDMKEIMGREVFPAYRLIEFLGRKLDSVYFLDSWQRQQRVVLGTPKELAASYQRSKWDLLQQ